MFSLYNDILTLEANALWEDLEVVSYSNYKNLKHRNKLQVVQRGGNGRQALISWESLPQKLQTKIIHITGDPYLRVKGKTLMDVMEKDQAAFEYYSAYKIPDGRHLPEEIQREYRTNCMILKACNARHNEIITKRRSLGGSIKGVWSSIVDEVNKLNTNKYPHSLPSNERRLKGKMKQLLKEGYVSMIHKGYCNSNSRKVSSTVEDLIISLYCLPNKPYAVTVHELYLDFLAGKIDDVVDVTSGELFDKNDFIIDGEPLEVSEKTILNYINSPKNKSALNRKRMNPHGYTDVSRPHNHRNKPVYSLSKISMDDRDLPRKMADGTRVKTYYAYDVASGAIIGFSHSRNKDAQLFTDCLRDMFRNLNNMSMGMPMEVEVEHHLVNNFKDDLMKAGSLFPFVRWCAPGNSQEKHAEHFNKQLKYQHEKRYQEGIGRFYLKNDSNVPKTTKVWDENGMQIKEKTYTYDQLMADAYYAQDSYNNALHPDQKRYKGMSRLDVLMYHVNPDLPKLDQYLISKYLGNKTATSVRRSQYVRVQNNNYMLPEPKVLERLKNLKVDAYWLPADEINEVYLYQGETFICKCDKLITYNTAICERTEVDEEAKLVQDKYIAQYDAWEKEQSDRIKQLELITNSVDPNIEPEIVEEPKEEETYDDDFGMVYEDYKQTAIDSL